jgi:PIN domain nuclease of toxin-antitoxin system
VRIGKLPEAARIVHRLAEVIAEQGFRTLPISLEHGRISGLLPGAYRDPFDSMIAAPSLLDDIPVVTNDPGVMGFGVAVVW